MLQPPLVVFVEMCVNKDPLVNILAVPYQAMFEVFTSLILYHII